MKRNRTRPIRRVLAALWMGGRFGTDVLAGVFRRAAERGGWDVRVVRFREILAGEIERARLDGGLDGLVFDYWASEFPRVLKSVQVPVVLLDVPGAAAFAAKRPRVAVIRSDNAAIGRAAARELLGHGVYRSFGFVGASEGQPWSAERGAAFRATLEAAGAEGRECPGGVGSPGLAAWLRSLPAPAGVFAANDETGARVLSVCRAARLPVPGRVSVLGVDDETFLCENAHPPLSSVVPDFERQGWLAACAIESMAEGRAAAPPAAVGVRGIVRRASTRGGPSAAGLLVQRALAFIRQRACDGIGVPDVAAHLGVSRRLLDLRFREEQGRTVLDAIQERCLGEVRRRLSETDETIGEIAAACGYGDVSHLRRLFRARFHAGMRTWRESVRRRPPKP